MEEYNGIERRLSAGRRHSDFCSEHCLLKQVYEGKFQDIKEASLKAEKERINAVERVAQIHADDLKKIDEIISKKAPLWVVILLVSVVVGSLGGSWLELRKISDKLSSVSAKQELVLKGHSYRFFNGNQNSK